MIVFFPVFFVFIVVAAVFYVYRLYDKSRYSHLHFSCHVTGATACQHGCRLYRNSIVPANMDV